jgi:hypothetical protein
MNNHYHLLTETPHPNLSRAIKWINVSYAAYFNRKRRRCGHLFQGRFKAIVIDADEYLKQLSRYIHLNPVRARMVDLCKDYPWSSYPVFGGYAKAPEWLETYWLLSLFGENRGHTVPFLYYAGFPNDSGKYQPPLADKIWVLNNKVACTGSILR